MKYLAIILALLWNDQAKVNIIHFNERFITAKVHLLSMTKQFIFTCLYEEPKQEKRMLFWNYFAQIYSNITMPYIVLGDYNQILYPNDNNSGATPNLNLITVYRNILNNLQLRNSRYKGQNYTWKRGQLLEKLDQAYGNHL